MKQKDPLAMIAYGIGILPLINNLKQEIPDVTHPWYADYCGALGTFAILETYFYSLTRQGLGRGYHPKPSKSIPIVRPENLEAGNCLEEVTDLWCVRAHVILGVTSWTTSPNAIVLEIVR